MYCSRFRLKLRPNRTSIMGCKKGISLSPSKMKYWLRDVRNNETSPNASWGDGGGGGEFVVLRGRGVVKG